MAIIPPCLLTLRAWPAVASPNPGLSFLDDLTPISVNEAEREWPKSSMVPACMHGMCVLGVEGKGGDQEA